MSDNPCGGDDIGPDKQGETAATEDGDESVSKNPKWEDKAPSSANVANETLEVIASSNGSVDHESPICNELMPYLPSFERVEVENEGDDHGDTVMLATFNWRHGGNEVYLVCSEDGVEKKIRMVRSGNSFMLVRYIPKKVYSYTYIVDGVERHAPDMPFVKTPNGIRNFVDCCNVDPIESIIVSGDFEEPNGKPFDNSKPSMTYLGQEPPQLPSSLLYRSPAFDDGDRVGNDIHIMANHIYQDGHSEQVFGPNHRSYTTVYRWKNKINDIVSTQNTVSIIYVTKAPQQVEESDASKVPEWFKVIK